jgi:hypothetical protein
MKKIKLLSICLLLASSFVEAQDLNISSAGQTGSSGTNWSTSGSNPVIISVTGTANINTSVISGYLSSGNLTIEANNITISSNINSASVNNLIFKARGNILQTIGANITTNGGDVTYWSDSDASAQGAICIGNATGSTSVITNGGAITLSGGANITTGFAASSVGFLPWAAKPYAGISVFNATLNAQGGNIIVRGRLNSQLSASLSARAVLCSTSTVKTSGSGTIAFIGNVGDFMGTNPWGIVIESTSIIETDSGAITMNGTGNTNRVNARGTVFGASNIQSVSGAITITDDTLGSSANNTGTFISSSTSFGKGLLASSTSNITISADKFQFDGSANNFTSSGIITFEPYGDSFRSEFITTGLVFGNQVQGITIGKAFNHGFITIASTIDIAGPIRFLNSDYIKIDASIKTANNIYIESYEEVRQTAAITAAELHLISGFPILTNVSNTVSKLIVGSIATPITSVDYVNSNALIIGNSILGVNSRDAVQIATMSGDLTVSRPVVSTQNAVSLFADKDATASSACSGNATSTGDIKISGSGSVTAAAGFRALLYSGNQASSTGLTTLVGGTSNIRYQIDATTNTATISPALNATGTFALYRETLSFNTSSTTFYNFNSGCELVYYFNRGNTNATSIAQTSNTGIGGSGAVNIGNVSANQVYTTKQGYSNGGVGSVYEFSTFIKSEFNSGFSAIGFTSVGAQPHANSGNPAVCLGVSVHGGGFIFYNNALSDSGSWTSGGVVNTTINDLLNNGSPDKWYKIILKITALTGNNYHLRLEVWPSNAAGTLLSGSASAVQERTYTNATIRNASTLYSYFGFGGQRVSNFDNYSMSLQGSTVIEAGAPVVVNGTAVLSPVLNNSINIEGNVTDDRNDAVTERGFVWNTMPNPTINDNKIVFGGGLGSFSGTINNLASGTYYLRAFATNTAGTSYGNQQTVIVPVQPSTILITQSIGVFNKTCASLASAAQSFFVSGSSLSAGILIGAVTGLEYSLNGISYQSSLTLNPVSGSVASTQVYVRMTSAQTSSFSGFITISSSGALGYSIATQGTYSNALAIITQPTVLSSSVCQNQVGETISFATAGSYYTVRWYRNSSNSYSGATLISGATSSSLQLATTTSRINFYFAELTSTTSSCTANTQIVTQTVTPLLSNISSISGPTNLASTVTTATYSVTAVSGASSYVWNLPSGLTLTSQTGRSVTVAVSSSFVSGLLTVKAVNDCGETLVRSTTVRKAAVLVGGVAFNVTGNSIICTNATQTYTATTVAGGVYSWTVPTGVTILSGQGTNAITVSTDVDFTSGRINTICNTSGLTLKATIFVAGIAKPSSITGITNLCGITSATYSVVDGAGFTYTWSVPSGMVITSGEGSSSIIVSVAEGTSGIIRVRAQSVCGFSSARMLTVSAFPILGRISGITRVCGAVEATFDTSGNPISNNPLSTYTYSVAAVSGVTSYNWTVPSGATILTGQGANSITVSYNLTTFESGLISVEGVNSCGIAGLQNINVSTATGTITGPTSLCPLTSATYNVPLDLGTDFVWTLPQGMTVTGGAGTANITVSITHPINFDHSNQVSVSFTTGCGGTRTLGLSVNCSDYTNLASAFCGATIDHGDRVSPIGVTGATGYKFNIYNADGTTMLASIENFHHRFSFTQMNFTFGATYQVRVQVKRGSVYGAEGAACAVTLREVPTTTLASYQCGETINYNDRVYPIGVSGATGYKFNIYNADGTTILGTVENPYHGFSFTQMNFTFGAAYQVRVQVKRGSVYGAEGAACAVTLSVFPITTLASYQCGEIVNHNDRVYPIGVSGATGYKFNIYNADGTTMLATIENPYHSFSFAQMDFTPGATYQVKVQVKRGSAYGAEGAACSITIFGGTYERQQVQENNNKEGIVSLVPSALTAYPNPFTTSFVILPIAGESAAVSYQIYDVTGKLLENREMNASDIKTHAIAENYAIGVYIVIIRQGTTNQTFKMIKQ